MVKPIGFYSEDGVVHPVFPAKGKRGYRAERRVRVRHRQQHRDLSLDDARRRHEARSPSSKHTDEGIKAPLAKNPGEWARNMNRLDLEGVDYPEGEEAGKVELKPENRVDTDPIPKTIEGVNWELDHLQGAATSRAQKAGEKDIPRNLDGYYTPHEKARREELLSAAKRLSGDGGAEKWITYWKNKAMVYEKVGKGRGDLEEAIRRHKASLVLGRDFGRTRRPTWRGREPWPITGCPLGRSSRGLRGRVRGPRRRGLSLGRLLRAGLSGAGRRRLSTTGYSRRAGRRGGSPLTRRIAG